MSFADTIRTSSERSRSRIVLALDIEDPDQQILFKKSNDVLREVSEYVCAIKINRQLILTLGMRVISQLVKNIHDCSLPIIMDAKLNDVAHTNSFMMRSYIQAGFDAVIASPVTGWEGGMDSVFELARKEKKGIILLVHMSNPGAEQFYSMVAKDIEEAPLFEHFTRRALEWRADGVVVGATRPEIIRRVRSIVGPSMAIYSPGVGVQGGDPKVAIHAGATYLIVGRAIFTSPRPRDAARALYESIK